MNTMRRTTATLLIAIFMISTLALAVSAEVYFEDEEVLWGCTTPIQALTDDGLTIEVWYEKGFAYFKATIPDCYNPATSYATFAFDVDDDNLADFQIQYIPSEGWKYSAMDNMAWQPWVEIPEDYILSNDGKVFMLELPVTVLSEIYRFGFQACRQGVYCTQCDKHHNAQIFYSTEAGELWYDGSDYVHSTYYVTMNRPSLKSELVPGKGKGLDRVIPNDNFAKGRQK